MPGDLRITLDDTRLKDLQREFDLYKYGVKEAARHATRDTIASLRGEFGDHIAARLNIDANALKNRIHLKYSYRSGNGYVWFGLAPVSLSALGAVQTPEGVRAGPVFRKGAFIVKKLNDQVFMRSSGSRNHFVKQTLAIAEESRATIERDIFPRVRGLFFFHLKKRLEESDAHRRKK